MKRMLIVLIALAVAGLASAQNRIVISPESIVVNPVPSFGVDVFFEGADGQPVYDVGTAVRIGVQPSEDAYVYLFDVRPNGAVTQILPNRIDPSSDDNFVRGGSTRFFPPRDAGYRYIVNPPRGESKVIAVASKERLDTRELAQFRDGESFATSDIGQAGFADRFSIVVRPIEQSQWVTDTAVYYVGERPREAQYATLDVQTNPNGSDVFLDGDFIGVTPLRFSARPGRHDLEITRDGYRTVTRSFVTRPGETIRIEASLERIRRDATVDFRTTPSGADVFVDGDFVGVTPVDNVRVSQGQHEVRFALNGYESTRQTFSVQAGDDTRVSATLRATTGSIRLQANVGGAQVFVDGRAVGIIPSGTGVLTIENVTPGIHQVTVVAPGYTTYVTDINVRSGQTASVTVRQTPL